MAPVPKPFEDSAKHFLAKTLGGQVMVRDTGRASGMRDFDLVDTDQNILHGVEVSSVQHPAVRATRVELRKLSESDLQLQSSWSVTVHEEVAVRPLREQAPKHLNRLTDLGVDGFGQSARRLDSSADDTIAALQRLGIVQARAMPDLRPSRLVPGSFGVGSLDAVHITDAVEAELWKADNRRKLAAVPDGAQRHMFVGLDHSHWYVSSQLIDGEVLPPPPSLPPEIDVAWIGVEDPASGALAIVIRVDANGAAAMDGTGRSLSLSSQADGPPADAGPCLECNGPGCWRPELRVRYDPTVEQQTERWVWVARCEADEGHWQLPGRSLTAREREGVTAEADDAEEA